MIIMGMEVSMILIWTVLAIAFAVLEGVTMGLTTIWFAVGSLAGMVMAMLGFGIPAQLTAFMVFALLTFAFIRPLAKKVLKVGETKTNVDSLIGKKGLVQMDILPYRMGQVKVSGQIWSAKTEAEDATVLKDAEVEVLRVDGVKLIVRPVVLVENKKEE